MVGASVSTTPRSTAVSPVMSSPTAALPCRGWSPRSALVSSTRLPGGTPTRRAAVSSAGGVTRGPAPGGTDPDVDGHRGGLDALHQGLEAVVVDHRALAVELEDQGDGALGLGLLELGLHEVHQNPVEEPADLDHRHVAGGAGGLGPVGQGHQRQDQQHGGRDEPG